MSKLTFTNAENGSKIWVGGPSFVLYEKLVWGPIKDKKFDQWKLPITLNEEEITKFSDLTNQCKNYLLEHGYEEESLGRLASCLYEKDGKTTLFAKLDHDKKTGKITTPIVDESNKTITMAQKKRHIVNVAIRVESIYVGNESPTLQVKVYKVKTRPEKIEENPEDSVDLQDDF